MERYRRFLFTLILLLGCICCIPSFGLAQQNRLGDLERKKRAMEKEIIFLTQARDSSRVKKETSFAELQLLNRQVYLREQLLKTIRAEVKELGRQIDQTTGIIISLEEDIEAIREQFGKLMIVTYKTLNKKSASFYVFSSASVSQGYKRAQYFRAISRMQQSQMKLIRKTRAFLARKKLELEQNKVKKQQVAIQEKQEQKKLVLLKEEQKTLFAKMKEDEVRFDQDLQDTKKRLTALNREIAKEITRIAAARKAKTKTNTKVQNDVINKLTSNFSSNKGKFPWPMPMPNGTITRHFGKQTLPGSGIIVELQGIDISTLPGQAVRNIFDGTVETIMPVMGQGKMVIVSHGNYYTVYANMQEVYVTAGQKLTMLDQIGAARTDPASGETKVHFQLYNERVPLNPETWLVRKN